MSQNKKIKLDPKAYTEASTKDFTEAVPIKEPEINTADDCIKYKKSTFSVENKEYEIFKARAECSADIDFIIEKMEALSKEKNFKFFLLEKKFSYFFPVWGGDYLVFATDKSLTELVDMIAEIGCDCHRIYQTCQPLLKFDGEIVNN